ncbi:MAG: hypothetical protein U0470_09925 [Anaerolineae bacterium]
MTAAVAVVAAVLIGAALVWVAAPLWQGAPAAASDDPRVVGLLVERERAGTLRDLDADAFDQRVAPGDHAALREEAVARGAAVLAALDGLFSAQADAVGEGAAAVEADVRSARAHREAGP